MTDMFLFFYWILFNSLFVFANRLKKICFLLDMVFYFGPKKSTAFFSVPNNFFPLYFFGQFDFAMKRRANSVRFIFGWNEQVQRNIGMKQESMIAVLVCAQCAQCSMLNACVHLLFMLTKCVNVQVASSKCIARWGERSQIKMI